MSQVFDIDIDVSNSTKTRVPVDIGVRASAYCQGTKKFSPHPSGFYFKIQGPPIDPVTGRFPACYKRAEELGFWKLDILTNRAYDGFSSKDELLACMEKEPDWGLLLNPKVVESLPHIGTHYDIVSRIMPRDVDTLADVLALIRPGKLKYVEDYVRDPGKVRENLYRRPKQGAYFKKSHAYAYALMIKAILSSPRFASSVEWKQFRKLSSGIDPGTTPG